jgi:hypothetical protein
MSPASARPRRTSAREVASSSLARIALPAALILVLAAAAPPLGEATPLGDPTIAAAGDIACDPASSTYRGGYGTATSCRQKYTSDLLVNGGFTAVLPLGDNQYYCGSLAAYKAVFHPTWGRVKAITHPTTGNHEYLTSSSSNGSTSCNSTNEGAAGYFNYFGSAGGPRGKGCYSFNIGSAWHLIALNSQCSHAGGCRSGSPQYAWLQSDLAANGGKCILAYWHIPLFSSGGLVSTGVKGFWQLLYAAHADLVVNGHDHIYERFAPQDANGVAVANGIREFVAGMGGDNHGPINSIATNSRVRNNTAFGVLKLTLHQGSYDWKFVPAAGSGTFADSGSASCHARTAGTRDTTPPSVPTRLTADAVSYSEVDLAWRGSSDKGGSGLAGYRVYRSNHGSTPAATVTRPSYRDAGLRAATTYRYTVSAFDRAGNESAHSAPVSAAIPRATRRLCVVPRVVGKRLHKARRAIRRARCSVGPIRRKVSRAVPKGHVIHQRPKAHLARPKGAKVRLVVSRGRRVS